MKTQLETIISDPNEGETIARLARTLRTCRKVGTAPYARTFVKEARGLYHSGEYERVLDLVDDVMSNTSIRDSTSISYINEFAALSAERIGDSRVDHWYKVALQHDHQRPVDARIGLRRNAGLSAMSRGNYRRADVMARQALSIATSNATVAPALTAKVHILLAVSTLRASFDGTGSDLVMGREHLNRARDLFSEAAASSDREYDDWLRLIEVYDAAYMFLEGNALLAERKLKRIESEYEGPSPTGVYVTLHDVSARIALDQGRYKESLQHIDRAEALCQRARFEYFLSAVLRLRVAVGTRMDKPELVVSTLNRMRGLNGVAAKHNYRAATIVALDYLPTQQSPWWPWAVMVGIVIGVAGYVHSHQSSTVSRELLTPFSMTRLLSTTSDDASLKNSSLKNSSLKNEDAPDASPASPPCPDDSDAPSSTMATSAADSADDGSPTRPERTRMDIYGPHGGHLGSMPVPRLLRRDDKTHYVGIEMGDRVLIVEQFSSASNDVVQRTDGGGFERFELPFKISGVVVASITRASGAA